MVSQHNIPNVRCWRHEWHRWDSRASGPFTWAVSCCSAARTELGWWSRTHSSSRDHGRKMFIVPKSSYVNHALRVLLFPWARGIGFLLVTGFSRWFADGNAVSLRCRSRAGFVVVVWLWLWSRSLCARIWQWPVPSFPPRQCNSTRSWTGSIKSAENPLDSVRISMW